MIIKNLIEEDITNYKKTSMFIGFPHCSFKCEKECGIKMCQNSSLVKSPDIEVSAGSIVHRYLNNPLTSAVVFGGLEPFDSWGDVKALVAALRLICDDDIVIYTGYNADEIQDKIMWLKFFPNIIVKFGRFVPNDKSHYDDVLGVNLASSNQYGEKIS